MKTRAAAVDGKAMSTWREHLLIKFSHDESLQAAYMGSEMPLLLRFREP